MRCLAFECSDRLTVYLVNYIYVFPSHVNSTIISTFIPAPFLNLSIEDLESRIYAVYRLSSGISKESAQQQYVEIAYALPYFGIEMTDGQVRSCDVP